MKVKSVDINQRIPLSVLKLALSSYLNEDYSNEYVQEQLEIEFSGANRIKKGIRIVNKIITKNPVSTELLENKEALKNIIRRPKEANVIIVSLLNIAFPFSFDLLSIFGKFFSIQDIVNRETIMKNISKIYGGNRQVVNTYDCLVPMFIEAGFVNRLKPGLFSMNAPIYLQSELTKQLYKTSFNTNTLAINNADLDFMNPYFVFIDG